MAKNIKMSIAEKARVAITNSSFSPLESIKQNITVLEELKSFIPPLLDSELAQLKANLLANGCKDPLLLWETTKDIIGLGSEFEPAYVLIDGHNRYGICKEFGITFNVQLLSFNSFKEVKEHMIDLQLGRRNLNAQQVSYLRGLRYNTEKNDVIGNLQGKKEEIDSNGQNVHLEKEPKITTAERLAKEYNVGEKTIRRDAAFAEGLEKLTPTLRNEVLSGKKKVDKNKIQLLAKSNEENQSIDDIEKVDEILQQVTKEKSTENNQIDIAQEKYNKVLSTINEAYQTRSIEAFEAVEIALQEFKLILN
ncbi:ParB N-terminal domain-containing protein [Arcicella lustrica]|uniref:ParB/Sulfiredoxin domain-containing protein n=1 Tax=Arcicella lustrica TaxID=2984196 RepID=A0ABU5SQ04_9BACT|nr:hypothetical protein [Arcicella sp. DC25W]MEA5429380.1 hypothetical protein [Arcicella sp. DC25W]